MTSGKLSVRSALARWYMLAILTLFVIISYIDRMILSLLVTPIKADLDLSDTQISLLLGLAFALFYGMVSLPAGYLVDRFARKWLLLGAVLVWTTLTLVSGFATSFPQLLLCRAGVGLGEALLAPAAYSLISQSFDGRARSWAFTTFSLGNAVGGGVALAVVGVLLHALDQGSLAGLGGSTASWGMVLILLGAGGLLLSILLLTMDEPARDAPALGSGTSTAEAARHFWARRADYGPLYAANLLLGIAVFGSAAWLPSMVERAWHLPLDAIGKIYGLIQILSALAGLLLSGWFLQSAQRYRHFSGIPMTATVACLLAGMAFAALPFLLDVTSTWWAFGIAMFMLPCLPVVNAMVLTQITPARMVGKFSALTFLVVSAIGPAIGPTVIAWLGEGPLLRSGSLENAIAVGAGLPLMGASALYLWLTLRAAHGKLAVRES